APKPVVIEPPAPICVEPDAFPWQTSSPPLEPGIAEPLPFAPQSDAAPDQDGGHALSATARRYANEGRLADAIEWGERAIAADKMNPAHHYLLATVRQEQGQTEAAAQSLMRALYLDPNFVLAHFGLANVELARGRRREARRHFANALATLRAHAHDEVLPESDGLTAGRLVEIITSVLASLPRADDDSNVRSMRA
ncbi:MAG: hypothetical protein ACYC7A_11385, partial [Thermoanaerobaculia bacterium]